VLRIALAVLSATVVGLTGVVWWTTDRTLSGLTISQALGAGTPRSAGGAMNILLIGLDSRKDQQGNDLPQALLDQLHAGDSDSGGYNTNTLLLVHISADDHVTAFSIPRDDYVSAQKIPGYSHIKIKQAYGLAKADTEQKLVDRGVDDPGTLESAGREAGRAATLRQVRDLTGQPIDYFAEVTLAGFYDVASALGSVEVCLNHAVSDDFSGADFPAGTQRLDAAQAVAFVRQRHGLDNGDLDRTHRQQAFLISVLHQLHDPSAAFDVARTKALMTTIQKDVVLSTGWDSALLTRLGGLDGSGIRVATLPVVRYDTVDGQDVNIVDPAAIRREVAAAFDGQDNGDATHGDDAPKPASTVDVVNAGDAAGLADRVSQWLVQRGFTAGEVRNPTSGEPTTSAVTYGPGAGTDAASAATLLGLPIAPDADPALADHRIRVMLGADYSPPDILDQAAQTTAVAATADASDSVPAPDAGRPLSGGSIPCVD
jgi:LCP family protein required for cell wall assembly